MIASSTAAQKSLILGGHSNSLFTEVLLEALAQPGPIEVTRAFEVLRDEVPKRAKAVGYEQSPRLSAADYERIVLKL
ncbi:MAG: hypothetical protein GYB67_09910 [Chloroflexi bacterium]|nr:hypothetical protein [Chloroflexota bacterium]